MDLPDPKPGQVVRFSYLWEAEAKRHREEGVKDRPCLVAYQFHDKQGRHIVGVAPITHTPQADKKTARPIPIKTARRLGLDDRQSWVVTSQTNEFVWPGHDLRPADPRVSNKTPLIGHMPERLTHELRETIFENDRTKKLSRVRRDHLQAHVEKAKSKEAKTPSKEPKLTNEREK